MATSESIDGMRGAERDERGVCVQRRDQRAAARESLMVAPPSDASILRDPQPAFEYFRERHPGRTALEENKALLSEKYTTAKVKATIIEARAAFQEDTLELSSQLMMKIQFRVTSKNVIFGSRLETHFGRKTGLYFLPVIS